MNPEIAAFEMDADDFAEYEAYSENRREMERD
jgi:hypothetical protein